LKKSGDDGKKDGLHQAGKGTKSVLCPACLVLGKGGRKKDRSTKFGKKDIAGIFLCHFFAGGSAGCTERRHRKEWKKDVFINGGDEKLFFNIFAGTCASNRLTGSLNECS
jgi:hypothetical protein